MIVMVPKASMSDCRSQTHTHTHNLDGKEVGKCICYYSISAVCLLDEIFQNMKSKGKNYERVS